MNAAVIGVGNMGRHHVRNCSEIANINLVAIADINEKIGQPLAEKYHCRFYKDYREMLKKEKLDFVSICVPTKLHKKVAIDAITSGCHILIEKPIASNISEAKEIIQKAKARGIKFSVGHIERFNPAVLKLKEMIDAGKLGEITSIVTRRLGPMPNQIKDANVVIDIGVHDLDLMNWFYGQLPSYMMVNGGRALNKDQCDHADILLKYGKYGALAQINWITPIKIRKMNITGTKAYAEINFITQELDVYESNYSTDYNDFGEFVIKFGEPKEKKTIKVQNIEPLKAEIKSFVRAIRENTRPMVTAREAIDALDIACKIDRMMSKG